MASSTVVKVLQIEKFGTQMLHRFICFASSTLEPFTVIPCISFYALAYHGQVFISIENPKCDFAQQSSCMVEVTSEGIDRSNFNHKTLCL